MCHGNPKFFSRLLTRSRQNQRRDDTGEHPIETLTDLSGIIKKVLICAPGYAWRMTHA
jgi:hypothetical protein